MIAFTVNSVNIRSVLHGCLHRFLERSEQFGENERIAVGNKSKAQKQHKDFCLGQGIAEYTEKYLDPYERKCGLWIGDSNGDRVFEGLLQAVAKSCHKWECI